MEEAKGLQGGRRGAASHLVRTLLVEREEASSLFTRERAEKGGGEEEGPGEGGVYISLLLMVPPLFILFPLSPFLIHGPPSRITHHAHTVSGVTIVSPSNVVSLPLRLGKIQGWAEHRRWGVGSIVDHDEDLALLRFFTLTSIKGLLAYPCVMGLP